MTEKLFTGTLNKNQNKTKQILYEPRRERTGFLHMRKKKTQISFAVTAELIGAFVFARRIVRSLYYLSPKFQASGFLLWLCGPVCVGPGRRPRGPVFSERGSCVHDVFKIIKHCLYCLMPKDFRELITTLHYSTQCPYTLAFR